MVTIAEVAPAPPARAVARLAPVDRTRRVTIAAAGDILIHEAVWQSALAHGGGERFDFWPVFERLEPFIAAADVAICHLEVPLSADNTGLSSYPRFNAPFELADAIAAAGYDGCSVASNHTLDRGVAGIDATLGHLDRVGLRHAGAARSPEEAAQITTFVVRGVQIAHLSYTYGFNGLRRPPGEEWRAHLIHPGTIVADAARATSEGADLVLVSLHWGDEYVHTPSQYQHDVAAAIAPSPDIDLVIGHHAHVVQPITRVGDTWVAYGLGNQVSNMGQPERRDGAILNVTFEAEPGADFVVTSVQYLATWVDRDGHRVVVAPPDSWERTSTHVAAFGAEVRPMTPLSGPEVPQ